MRTLGSRALGMDVSAYLVGDILVDTGFAYVREPLLRALDGRSISMICCTHSHEDHTGNAAVLSDAHRCPVYLRHADQLWDEGVKTLAPYRRAWWGHVTPFSPLEMPEVVESGGRRLRAVAAPGPLLDPGRPFRGGHRRRLHRRSLRVAGGDGGADLGQPLGRGAIASPGGGVAAAADADRPRSDHRRPCTTSRTQGRPDRNRRAVLGGIGRRRRRTAPDRAQGVSEGSFQGPVLRIPDQPPVFAAQFCPHGRQAGALRPAMHRFCHNSPVPTIDDFRAALAGHTPQEIPDFEGLTRAAVAAILRPAPAGPELLFIHRAEDPRDPWSGHMAFPGGKVEAVRQRPVGGRVARDP